MKDSLDRNSYIKNSSRNFAYGTFSRVFNIIIKFGVRTVFIKFLGEQYLGINGLYTNVLTILSLAECGFGAAVVYSLYKPIVDDDKEKIKAIMQFFKKVYRVIGLVVLCVGCALIPFLKYLVTDITLVNNTQLVVYYALFLADTVASYLFFAYKQTYLNADQRNYLVSRYELITDIVKSIIQVILIIAFKAYIFFLVTQICCTLVKNILVARKVDKLYPFLFESAEPIDKSDKRRIIEDVKALFLQNIGNVALNGTDNLIISSMISTVIVGIYSNYVLIMGSVEMVLIQLFKSIQASMGHYFANNDKEANYYLFKRVDFLNFWIYGFSTIALYTLYNDFIVLWLGDKYILDNICVAIICANFYVCGIMRTLWTIRATLGLFVQGKYRYIFTAVINLAISIVLAKPLGIIGVFLGTLISRLSVSCWYDPYVILKHAFDKKPFSYYALFIYRFLLVAGVSVLLQVLKPILCFTSSNIVNFIIMMAATAVIPNLILVVVNIKSPYLKYYFDLLKRKVFKK